MVSWFSKPCSPIGVDIGSRSIKLLQLDGSCTDLWEAARWDVADTTEPQERDDAVVDALQRARQGRNFRGREAVFCISGRDLFVQNIRVPQAEGDDLRKIVHFEAAGRLPFSSDQAEIRYLEAADVRQGDTIRREVILMACPRPAVERILAIAQRAALVPLAIDVEPAALLRCYAKQHRRDEDQQSRVMYVNIGAATTTIVIARGTDSMFIKYVDVGGGQLDEAVAAHLEMPPADAVTLRRHNGDRRADQRDPEIMRSLGEAIRPVLERLAHELSLCIRYYSVTFRGQQLSRIVLGGGEASAMLADWLSSRLDLPCEIGNPLRTFPKTPPAGPPTQWDVAAGLALRTIN
jgi:type IV pilus assembly protein PilM